MRLARLADYVWWGRGTGPSVARLVLSPVAAAYRTAMGVRNRLYDAGALRAHSPQLPALSVGNLSVGGTGKTPVSAWLASELAARGARPAIVMRGYGEDETLVHAGLNPSVPVITAPDRVDGITRAAAAGADVAVLDDAFQHRRVSRVADAVLVSADRWTGQPRLLPAGPWREPLSALRRASLLIVTRKAVSATTAATVVDAVQRSARGVPAAIAALIWQELRTLGGTSTMPLQALAGTRVLAIAGIGDPQAFLRQLAMLDATVRSQIFPDHYLFTSDDAIRLATILEPGEMAVCTLKDAVKLAPHWPREAAPLWYVSQSVRLEVGSNAVQALLRRVLDARQSIS